MHAFMRWKWHAVQMITTRWETVSMYPRLFSILVMLKNETEKKLDKLNNQNNSQDINILDKSPETRFFKTVNSVA